MDASNEALVRILEVGAEGGSMEIVGQRHAGAWRFRSTIDSRTMGSLFEEEEFPPSLLHQQSGWLDWAQVLERLDRDRCWDLTPLYVHPEFFPLVTAWLSPKSLDAHAASRWERVLGTALPKVGRRTRAPELLRVDVSLCASPVHSLLLQYAAFPTVQALLNLLFDRAVRAKAPPHSYGTAWALRNQRTKQLFAKVGTTDDRTLQAAGIRPSERLTVVLL